MDADTVADATHPSVHCHGVSPAEFDLAAGGTAMVGVQIICPNGANIPANQNSGSVIVMGTFVSNGDTLPAGLTGAGLRRRCRRRLRAAPSASCRPRATRTATR